VKLFNTKMYKRKKKPKKKEPRLYKAALP